MKELTLREKLAHDYAAALLSSGHDDIVNRAYEWVVKQAFSLADAFLAHCEPTPAAESITAVYTRGREVGFLAGFEAGKAHCQEDEPAAEPEGVTVWLTRDATDKAGESMWLDQRPKYDGEEWTPDEDTIFAGPVTFGLKTFLGGIRGKRGRDAIVECRIVRVRR